MPSKRPPEERFRAKIVEDPESGCHVWTGSRVPDGYGHFNFHGRLWLAHRLAWHLERGPIPPGMVVCHRCDNPPCVNVGHLFVGTQKDNISDAQAKGRTKLGKGRGSIIVRGPGVYEVIVSAGKSPTGKYLQRSRRVRGTFEDADRLRLELLDEVARA